MIRKQEFSIESLWTWFLRILMGLVSFLLYEVYQSVRSMDKQMADIKVMIVEGQKDIYYLREEHKDFKQTTERKISYLENENRTKNN